MIRLTEESLRPLCENVIGAAIEVHRHLGPGLLESAYQTCLAHEFKLRGIQFESQLEIPINYKGLEFGTNFRLDFLVEGVLVVELKAISRIDSIEIAQVMTYLKAMSLPLGLLINFYNSRLVDGVVRVVNGLKTGHNLSEIDLQA